ncbi:hypothetical protein N9247_01005, partial [bacterium]|nr:hypothetical protein [bacterium]
LEARLKGKYPRARKIATEKELLLERRNRLNGHAKLVNTKWQKTDLTPYEIFTKAIRYQDKVPDPNGLPTIPSITGVTFTGTQERRLQDNTQRVAGLHSKVAGQTPERLLNSHYWFGVRKSSLLQSGHGEVVSTLSSWTRALERLHRDYQEAACTAGLPGQAPCTAESLRKIVAATSYLPELGGTERLEAVGALAAEAEACEAVLQEHDSLHAQWEGLAATFEPQALGDSTVPTVIEDATRRFRAVGIAETEPLERISRWAQSIGALEEECSSIHDEFAELLPRLPDSLHENLVVSRQGLNRFATLAELITALPRELWRHRAALYDNPDLDSLLDDLRVRLGDLVAMRKQLEGVYSLSDLPPSESLQTDIRLVHSGGLFRWLSGSWRSARRRILALSLGTKPARKACLEQASTLQRYAKGLEDAAALSQENPALGDKYCGVDTAIDRITTLRAWYRRIREGRYRARGA